MQLNIYVPKDREPTLRHLDRVSRRVGRPKSELVLAAIDAYLDAIDGEGRSGSQRALRTFDLGRGEVPARSELYEHGRPT